MNPKKRNRLRIKAAHAAQAKAREEFAELQRKLVVLALINAPSSHLGKYYRKSVRVRECGPIIEHAYYTEAIQASEKITVPWSPDPDCL